METFSALLAICAGNSPVGEFPTQRPVTRSFDVFFDVRLIKRLSKHSRGWWFETLSHPLWRHRNEKGPQVGATKGLFINMIFFMYWAWIRTTASVLCRQILIHVVMSKAIELNHRWIKAMDE